MILSDGCANVYAPKTLRASMGAAVRIPVIEAGAMPDAITQLRAKGITCLAAALYKSHAADARRRQAAPAASASSSAARVRA